MTTVNGFLGTMGVAWTQAKVPSLSSSRCSDTSEENWNWGSEASAEEGRTQAGVGWEGNLRETGRTRRAPPLQQGSLCPREQKKTGTLPNEGQPVPHWKRRHGWPQRIDRLWLWMGRFPPRKLQRTKHTCRQKLKNTHSCRHTERKQLNYNGRFTKI